MPLFELGILFSTCFALPIAIPLILVFFFRRTPGWASWSSALVGFIFSLSMKVLFTHARVDSFWSNAPLNPREWEDLYIVVQTGGTILITSGWFILSQLWGGRESPAQLAGREEFYGRLSRPLETAPEVLRDAALKQYTYLGWLCLVWMVAISLMALMPNTRGGHYSFIFMALLYGVVALVLLRLRGSVREVKAVP